MRFSGKVASQTSENGEKSSFGSDFDRFRPDLGFPSFLCILPPLVAIHCSKLSLHAIYKETNEPKLRKWQKNLISGPVLAQIWAPKTFFVRFNSTRC